MADRERTFWEEAVSKEWKSSGAGLHLLSGQQEQGSRCQAAVMERVKGMK